MLPVLLLCLLATAVGRAEAASHNDDNMLHYENLYGSAAYRASLTETLLRLGAGAVNFLRDGEDLLGQEVRESTPKFGEEYDFVVVGAGSAGATLASRLSEIKDARVLLIEAGRTENFLMDLPVLANYLQFSDDINWKYQTEPSTSHCQGMKNRRCNWPRGKVMGGSSVLNYMIATRGHQKDYDNWAAMGNEGWSYSEVLKYFKKLETIDVPELRADSQWHNTEGPLHIGHAPWHTPLATSFLEAGLEMGYPVIDYNGEQRVGFSYHQLTTINGTRMSTNRAYLYPVHYRKNLFVTRHSHVTKVLIDPKRKRVFGVEFIKGKVKIQVKARKEVILCAGAIGSPQILMLSGVGPSKHLTEMNIKVLQDAPVGENLMDHIAYGGLVFLVNQPVSILTQLMINPLEPYLDDFLLKRTGPFTTPGACEALAFIDVDKPNELDAYPNVELLFIAGSVVSDIAIKYNFGISDEYWSRIYQNITGRHSWTVFPMLMRPNSRGKILLHSKNPKMKPKIFANYMDDPEDVRILVKAVRAAIAVSKTKAMRRFKSHLHEARIPGCDRFEYDSDEYWECAVRTFTLTIYHHSGTCKMAPENDPTSVVNPRLQVKGIRGLRVADASIMPVIMTGHPNVPIVMIAEKAADMIKEDWNYIKRRGSASITNT